MTRSLAGSTLVTVARGRPRTGPTLGPRREREGCRAGTSRGPPPRWDRRAARGRRLRLCVASLCAQVAQGHSVWTENQLVSLHCPLATPLSSRIPTMASTTTRTTASAAAAPSLKDAERKAVAKPKVYPFWLGGALLPLSFSRSRGCQFNELTRLASSRLVSSPLDDRRCCQLGCRVHP